VRWWTRRRRARPTVGGLEAALAALYTDAAARARFRVDPAAFAAEHALSPADTEALCGIDRSGLELAAGSFERKRARARSSR